MFSILYTDVLYYSVVEQLSLILLISHYNNINIYIDCAIYCIYLKMCIIVSYIILFCFVPIKIYYYLNYYLFI